MHVLLPNNAKAPSVTTAGDRCNYLRSAVAPMATTDFQSMVGADATRQCVILLIDSDMSFISTFTKAAIEYGFQVDVLTSQLNLRQALQRSKAQMLAIGSMSQGADIFSTCRDVRQINGGIPIMWLHSVEDEFDQALMLELGADVCISKSSNIRVMLAQMKSLRRRMDNDSTLDLGTSQKPGVITHGRLVVAPSSFQFYVDGRSIALSAGHFAILLYLVEHANEVVPRHILVPFQSAFSRAVDTKVNRLRACLKAAGLPFEVIRSVRGKGYMFVSNLCNLQN